MATRDLRILAYLAQVEHGHELMLKSELDAYYWTKNGIGALIHPG